MNTASSWILVLVLTAMSFAQKSAVKEFRCPPGLEAKVVNGKLTCAPELTFPKAAAMMEEFMDEFVPKIRILTQRYRDAQNWALINPDHPDAVKTREEIASREPDVVELMKRFQSLASEIQPLFDDKAKVAKNQPAVERILNSGNEGREAAEEMVREKRRYNASR